MTRHSMHCNNAQASYNPLYPHLTNATLPVRSHATAGEPEMFPFESTFDGPFYGELPSTDMLDNSPSVDSFFEPLSNITQSPNLDVFSHARSETSCSNVLPTDVAPYMSQNRFIDQQHQTLASATTSSFPTSYPLYNEVSHVRGHSFGYTDRPLSYGLVMQQGNAGFDDSGMDHYQNEQIYHDNLRNNYSEGSVTNGLKYSLQSSPSTLLSDSFDSAAYGDTHMTANSSFSNRGMNFQTQTEATHQSAYAPSISSFGSLNINVPSQNGRLAYGPNYSNAFVAQPSILRSTPSYAGNANIQSPATPSSNMIEFPNPMARSNSKYPDVPGHKIVEYSESFIRCQCGGTYKGIPKNVRSNFKRHLGKPPCSCPYCGKTLTRHDNLSAHKRKYHPQEAAT